MNTPHEQRPLARVIRRKLVALPESATVQQACTLMHQHRIGAIVVTDADAGLQGIFTGRDAVRLLAEGRNPAHTRLAEVMTRNPAHIPPGHHAIHALRLMHHGGFRHVPVVENGRVIGIVSTNDFRAMEHDRLDEETGYWERL
jgi:CBS domain-containing protein